MSPLIPVSIFLASFASAAPPISADAKARKYREGALGLLLLCAAGTAARSYMQTGAPGGGVPRI